MKRRMLVVLALLLCLPMIGETQSINYYPAGGTSLGSTAVPASSSIVLGTGQSLTLCNTADCATDYERAVLDWSGNIARLGVTKGGSGSNRALMIYSQGADIYIRPVNSSTAGWRATSTSFYPENSDEDAFGAPSQLATHLFLSRSIQGSKSKTLTDNTATAFVRLTVSDDDYEGCEVIYTAFAEDADTDARQTRTGKVAVAILNNSGTETAVFSTGDSAVAVTAGTLTCTFDSAGGTNTIDLRATCDTSLDAAAETLTFEYRLDCPSAITTVTPQ